VSVEFRYYMKWLSLLTTESEVSSTWHVAFYIGRHLQIVHCLQMTIEYTFAGQNVQCHCWTLQFPIPYSIGTFNLTIWLNIFVSFIITNGLGLAIIKWTMYNLIPWPREKSHLWIKLTWRTYIFTTVIEKLLKTITEVFFLLYKPNSPTQRYIYLCILPQTN
jgi:hypothetical protein